MHEDAHTHICAHASTYTRARGHAQRKERGGTNDGKLTGAFQFFEAKGRGEVLNAMTDELLESLQKKNAGERKE